MNSKSEIKMKNTLASIINPLIKRIMQQNEKKSKGAYIKTWDKRNLTQEEKDVQLIKNIKIIN